MTRPRLWIETAVVLVFMMVGAGGCSQASPKLGASSVLRVPQSSEEPLTLQFGLGEVPSGVDWHRSFVVYVDSSEDQPTPLSVQGKYRLEADSVIFRPDFPFRAGTKYVVRIDAALIADNGEVIGERITDDGHEYFETRFALPLQSVPATPEVVSIYPSGDELPANLLRFYVYFSTPMRRGQAESLIRLVDEYGNNVPNAFMTFKQELWSPDQTRLTVLFDPGRIKRGVETNLELGAPLVSGASYQLVVDSGWTSAEGRELQQTHTKQFRVVAALRSVPDPARWEIHAVHVGTQEELTVQLDRSYDHALLQQLIRVKDQTGRWVDGRVSVDRHETRWRFRPSGAWGSGKHELVIDAILEDVAGNNLQGLLDRPVGTPLSEVASLSRSFEPRE